MKYFLSLATLAFGFFGSHVATAPSPLVEGPPVHLGSVGAGEGPAWRDGYLYFTGGNRITRRNSEGDIEVYREPAGGANGLLFDLQGRLVVCESGNRRVTRTEPDGTISILAEKFEGKRFNTPNDLSMDSKGRIYFSDPRYGNRDNMEMRDPAGQLVEGVYRIDGPGLVTRVISHEVDRPNGLLVSSGDKYLYVADNNNNAVGGARKLWRFNLRSNGDINPRSRKLIFNWDNARGPDGLKMDSLGNLYVAAGLNKPHLPFETADKYTGGIYVLSPKGRLLQFISIPNDEVTNCAFGGLDRKTLFVTAGGNLWSVRTKHAGRPPGAR